MTRDLSAAYSSRGWNRTFEQNGLAIVHRILFSQVPQLQYTIGAPGQSSVLWQYWRMTAWAARG
jgi:hypothetical protein